MNIGRLRHRITLEAPEETITAGEPTIPWTLKATVWGEMEGLSGSDRTGLVAETAVRFRIRHRSDITPRWRVGIEGTSRKFQIVSVVDPNGRKEELLLVTQELIA